MDPNRQLSADSTTLLKEDSQHRRLVGRLVYLSILRPDIDFTVDKLSQFMSKPTSVHLDALHH